jgi:hypothetical protein
MEVWDLARNLRGFAGERCSVDLAGLLAQAARDCRRGGSGWRRAFRARVEKLVRACLTDERTAMEFGAALVGSRVVRPR